MSYRAIFASTLCATCLIGSSSFAGEFDAQMKACHDAVWQMDEFKNIPNAGVSIHLGGYDGSSFYAHWIIDWDNL